MHRTLVSDLTASSVVFIDQYVLSNHPLSAALLDMAQLCSDLEEKYSRNRAELTQRCSDLKEKYSQSQADLAQTFASLDDARSLISSLNS